MAAKTNSTKGHVRGRPVRFLPVGEIHDLRVAGWLQREIAERYGIRQSNVSMILAGRSWSDHAVDKPAPARKVKVTRSGT